MKIDTSKNPMCKDCIDEYGFCPEYQCYEHNFNSDGTRKVKDEEYVPSATNGDYSPGNPWDAPGMSVKDFI